MPMYMHVKRCCAHHTRIKEPRTRHAKRVTGNGEACSVSLPMYLYISTSPVVRDGIRATSIGERGSSNYSRNGEGDARWDIGHGKFIDGLMATLLHLRFDYDVYVEGGGRWRSGGILVVNRIALLNFCIMCNTLLRNLSTKMRAKFEEYCSFEMFLYIFLLCAISTFLLIHKCTTPHLLTSSFPTPLFCVHAKMLEGIVKAEVWKPTQNREMFRNASRYAYIYRGKSIMVPAD